LSISTSLPDDPVPCRRPVVPRRRPVRTVVVVVVVVGGGGGAVADEAAGEVDPGGDELCYIIYNIYTHTL